MRSLRITRKAALIVTMLGLVALIVPGSASANHQSVHGALGFNGATSASGAVCRAVQPEVIVTGADVNIIPPGVPSARVTATGISECASLPTVSGALTLNLFREVPPLSGSVTLLATSGAVSCTAYPCTATLPTTTVTRNANARFILQAAHTWNLPTGTPWHVAEPPFCWLNSVTQAYCDSWVDFFLP